MWLVRLSKQFFERTRYPSGGCRIDPAEPANEPDFVERSHLIQRDLPVPSVENAIDPIREAASSPGHRRDNYSAHRAVQFRRRDYEARPSLSDLRAHGRVERRQVDAELFDHHVHSFSSNALGMFCQSRQSSMSSPCSASAALICSSHPARGCADPADRRITRSPTTAIEISSLSPACSITDLGSRTPRELPIRTSFALSPGSAAFFRGFRFARVFVFI